MPNIKYLSTYACFEFVLFMDQFSLKRNELVLGSKPPIVTFHVNGKDLNLENT
jgi:hypothetical protein